jgi:hypothetical protein
MCAGGARARLLGPATNRLTRWDSAAALAPIVLGETLELAAPPGVEVSLTEVDGWDAAGIARVAEAMARTFGAALSPSDFTACRTVADVAGAVEAARARIAGASHGH